MITVVEVKKNANESGTNLIRRFTRKVQETGIIQKVKGNRYSERPASKLTVKKATLKRLARRKEHEKLLKLGKAVKIVRGRRR
ncbi:MAG: 30S ribosomal protein S21 [Candidatus Nomurabacteria bacterium]|jgi:ribosomal protein S21|nr:30S ribosomal protein S21 [Candidatus Nomurabacteria bacterium]